MNDNKQPISTAPKKRVYCGNPECTRCREHFGDNEIARMERAANDEFLRLPSRKGL